MNKVEGKKVNVYENNNSVETMDNYKEYIDNSFKSINEGDMLNGTVVAISDDGIYLDINYYTQAYVPNEEVSNDPSCNIKEDYPVGTEILGIVVNTDDGDGNIKLSIKKATAEIVWDKLLSLKESGHIFKKKISGIVNGGVIVYVEGIRGFIPASQLSFEYIENLEEWLGKEVEAKLITVDKNSDKIVLSAKVVLTDRRINELNTKKSALSIGSIYDGTVETLKPYGAFVNIGDGISGLVHISMISNKRLKHPGEVLEEGDSVKVKLMDIKSDKLQLSIKDVTNDEDVRTLDDNYHDYKGDSSISTTLGDILAQLGIK